MKLIDRSPGAFFVIIGLVVYGVIGVEAWVGVSGSYVLLAAALLLIATTAGLACVFMSRLLDDGAGDGAEADEAAIVDEAPVRSPLAHTPATSAPRRPSTGRPAHVA